MTEPRKAGTEPVERVAIQVDRLCWSGVLLGLAFTMTNVQQFAANGAPAWSLPWCTAWLLDPMVSVVLLSILRAEQVTARHGIRTGGWVRAAKWFTLTATYVMNTWEAYTAGSPALVVLHSVPPLVVFVAAEAVTDLRDKLGAAMAVAFMNTADHAPPGVNRTADTGAAVSTSEPSQPDAGTDAASPARRARTSFAGISRSHAPHGPRKPS